MISIVIPTLNSCKFLRETLHSIFAQDYTDFEVIVVDSYSENGTLGIAYNFRSMYPDKITVKLMGKQGQIAAINYGLKLAKGDIVTFINSDDTYERGCFSRVAQEFASKWWLGWLYGVGKVIDSKGHPCRSLVTSFKSIWWQKRSLRVLSLFDYISQPTVFWRKEIELEFNPEYPLCFDYEAWLRLWGLGGRPVFVNQHLANWRMHNDSISVKNTNAQIEESLRINVYYAQSWGDLVIQNLVAWIEKVVYGAMQ